ncbi:hypothetical protein GALL_547760 [mine drainage metagenome]|uniref:Uncharacterized protein n=1 Tax=mine drainage metagenome TaxID=410659 RepID=A0A1J5NY42_9ZZZZ
MHGLKMRMGDGHAGDDAGGVQFVCIAAHIGDVVRQAPGDVLGRGGVIGRVGDIPMSADPDHLFPQGPRRVTIVRVAAGYRSMKVANQRLGEDVRTIGDGTRNRLVQAQRVILHLSGGILAAGIAGLLHQQQFVQRAVGSFDGGTAQRFLAHDDPADQPRIAEFRGNGFKPGQGCVRRVALAGHRHHRWMRRRWW